MQDVFLELIFLVLRLQCLSYKHLFKQVYRWMWIWVLGFLYISVWVNRVLFSLDLAVTFDLSVCTRIEIGKKWCFRMIKYIKQLNLLSAE